MSQKRKLEEYSDPDYAEQPAKTQKCASSSSSLSNSESNAEGRADRIRNICIREIQAEISAREAEIVKIQRYIASSKLLLQKLRFAIISDYYNPRLNDDVGDHNINFSDNANDSKQSLPLKKTSENISENSLHPAVKSVLGTNEADCEFLLRGSRPVRKAAKTAKTTISEKLRTKKEVKRLQREALNNKEIRNDNSQNMNSTNDSSDMNNTDTSTINIHKPVEQLISARGHNQEKNLIVIGNTSKYIGHEEQSDGVTHKWLIYIIASTPTPIENLIHKATFFLHPSYKPNNIVDVCSPPFQLARRGWGEFPVRIRLYFKTEFQQKPVQIIHYLSLDKSLSGLQTRGSETHVEIWLRKNNRYSEAKELNICPQMKKETPKDKIIENGTEVENKLHVDANSHENTHNFNNFEEAKEWLLKFIDEMDETSGDHLSSSDNSDDETTSNSTSSIIDNYQHQQNRNNPAEKNCIVSSSSEPQINPVPFKKIKMTNTNVSAKNMPTGNGVSTPTVVDSNMQLVKSNLENMNSNNVSRTIKYFDKEGREKKLIIKTKANPSVVQTPSNENNASQELSSAQCSDQRSKNIAILSRLSSNVTVRSIPKQQTSTISTTATTITKTETKANSISIVSNYSIKNTQNTLNPQFIPPTIATRLNSPRTLIPTAGSNSQIPNNIWNNEAGSILMKDGKIVAGRPMNSLLKRENNEENLLTKNEFIEDDNFNISGGNWAAIRDHDYASSPFAEQSTISTLQNSSDISELFSSSPQPPSSLSPSPPPPEPFPLSYSPSPSLSLSLSLSPSPPPPPESFMLSSSPTVSTNSFDSEKTTIFKSFSSPSPPPPEPFMLSSSPATSINSSDSGKTIIFKSLSSSRPPPPPPPPPVSINSTDSSKTTFKPKVEMRNYYLEMYMKFSVTIFDDVQQAVEFILKKLPFINEFVEIDEDFRKQYPFLVANLDEYEKLTLPKRRSIQFLYASYISNLLTQHLNLTDMKTWTAKEIILFARSHAYIPMIDYNSKNTNNDNFQNNDEDIFKNDSQVDKKIIKHAKSCTIVKPEELNNANLKEFVKEEVKNDKFEFESLTPVNKIDDWVNNSEVPAMDLNENDEIEEISVDAVDNYDQVDMDIEEEPPKLDAIGENVMKYYNEMLFLHDLFDKRQTGLQLEDIGRGILYPTIHLSFAQMIRSFLENLLRKIISNIQKDAKLDGNSGPLVITANDVKRVVLSEVGLDFLSNSNLDSENEETNNTP